MNGWALQEPDDEPSPFLLSPQPVVGASEAAPPPSFEEELDELPDTYGTQALYLSACDPGRVFAYWDIDWSQFDAGEQALLRIARADGGVECESPIARSDSGHFADVTVPGGTYFAEIGSRREGAWHALARSGLVTLPPPLPAPEALPAAFATIPYEQSFAQLGEVLKPFAQHPEEGMAEIVARLQQEWVQHGALPLDQLSVDQRSSLESILRHGGFGAGDGGGGLTWPVLLSAGGDSSEYGPALAAFRALIEGAAPAARGGQGDATSHAPGRVELDLQWELWQRALQGQTPANGAQSGGL